MKLLTICCNVVIATSLALSTGICLAKPNEPKFQATDKYIFNYLKQSSSKLRSKLPHKSSFKVDDWKQGSDELGKVKNYIMPEGMPLSIYEINLTSGDPVDMDYVFSLTKSYISLSEKLQLFTQEVIESRYFQNSTSLELVEKYFEQEGEKFQKAIEETDKGVHLCLDYSKNMANILPNTIPNRSNLKAKTGMVNEEYYNAVMVAQNQLNVYNKSEIKNIEKLGKSYQDRLKKYSQAIDELSVETTKTLASTEFSMLIKVLKDYIATLDESIGKGVELYNHRNDQSIPLGAAFHGKVNTPYGHVKLITSGDAPTIYRKGYSNAIIECKNAYEEAWKSIRLNTPEYKQYYEPFK